MSVMLQEMCLRFVLRQGYHRSACQRSNILTSPTREKSCFADSGLQMLISPCTLTETIVNIKMLHLYSVIRM